MIYFEFSFLNDDIHNSRIVPSPEKGRKMAFEGLVEAKSAVGMTSQGCKDF